MFKYFSIKYYKNKKSLLKKKDMKEGMRYPGKKGSRVSIRDKWTVWWLWSKYISYICGILKYKWKNIEKIKTYGRREYLRKHIKKT